ncbi:hypothetical protein QYF36_016878 [Acer negundo]|nr:hypothetical protein QYF36_016878 [Acer negundo]
MNSLDKTFKAPSVPNLSKLTTAEVVALLQYHALNGYNTKGALKTTKGPISTLATNGAGKFDPSMTTAGDEVTLHTGVGQSRVVDTLLDSTPLAIFTVDSVLLPTELFGKKAPSPAPAGSQWRFLLRPQMWRPLVPLRFLRLPCHWPRLHRLCQWRFPEAEILLPTSPAARRRRLPPVMLLFT